MEGTEGIEPIKYFIMLLRWQLKKAKQDKTAIAFEDITDIRRMYQKGNGQGKKYGARMNGWSFAEIKRGK